jgi:hypothetical protein
MARSQARTPRQDAGFQPNRPACHTPFADRRRSRRGGGKRSSSRRPSSASGAGPRWRQPGSRQAGGPRRCRGGWRPAAPGCARSAARGRRRWRRAPRRMRSCWPWR